MSVIRVVKWQPSQSAARFSLTGTNANLDSRKTLSQWQLGDYDEPRVGRIHPPTARG